jgi:carbon monoxide dehydrogenase subunit G
MPSATFSHTVTVEVDQITAWSALQQPDTWANIGPVTRVTNPAFASDGTLVSFDWIADLGGKTYPGTAETTSYERPHRFELTMDTSEIAGDVIATVASDDPGSNVSVTITFRTKGILSAMFFPAIKQALASGFPQQVEDLAAGI